MDRHEMISNFMILIIISIMCTSLAMFGYKVFTQKETIFETVLKTDTIYVNVPDSSSLIQIDSLYHVIDSLENINYKYEDELNIALFKLERVRYYNDIAKNGNNIKYLRGWINRTLNE